MKQPKKCYIYKNKELVDICESMRLTEAKTNIHQATIRNCCMGIKDKPTKNGFFFSFKQLTKEEIEAIYKDHTIRKDVEINEEMDLLENNPKELFYIPKSKEGKKDMLKTYIKNNLNYKWRTQPIYMTKMEKKFLKHLIDNI